ncbi:MAG TPA: glycosyltransferase 87 family protein [Candidatus Binataceae bacterium]|nr:glycosyltransferase 87 family protein [Candidatus Binataceae bacterium]
MDLVSRLRNYQSPWLVRVALSIVWAVVLVRYALLLRELSSRATQYDFSLYYTSALAVRMGIDPYFSNLARLGRPLGFALPDPFLTNYTPYFLIAFEPLAAFPIRTAYWLWFSASTGVLVLAVIIIFREYDLAGVPAARAYSRVNPAIPRSHCPLPVRAESIRTTFGARVDASLASP